MAYFSQFKYVYVVYVLFLSKHQVPSQSTLIDAEHLKKEVRKLNEQVERYNAGYGAGAFTLEQLKNYTIPLREKISHLEAQIATATSEASQKRLETPTKREMGAFAQKATQTLQGLNFSSKRAIICNTIEKVVSNKQLLQVTGYIPLESNVSFQTSHRHCRPA